MAARRRSPSLPAAPAASSSTRLRFRTAITGCASRPSRATASPAGARFPSPCATGRASRSPAFPTRDEVRGNARPRGRRHRRGDRRRSRRAFARAASRPAVLDRRALVLIIALGALYLAVDPLAFRAYSAEELAIRGERRDARAPSRRSARDADPMQVSLAEGAFLPVLDFDAGKADTARGAATYAAKCAGCHGAAGRGPHRAVGDARRAGHLSAPRRPARGLSLPPALELRPWLARRAPRCRRSPTASPRPTGPTSPCIWSISPRRLSAAARHRQRRRRTRPLHRHRSAGPIAASARAGAAMGRTASASRPIFPR